MNSLAFARELLEAQRRALPSLNRTNFDSRLITLAHQVRLPKVYLTVSLRESLKPSDSQRTTRFCQKDIIHKG